MSNQEINTRAAKVASLTARQREVLTGLATGQNRKQMATDLGMSPNTLSNHCAAIYTRLEIHSVTEAIRVALAAGLVKE